MANAPWNRYDITLSTLLFYYFLEDKEIIGEITVILKGNHKKKTLEFNELSLKSELNDLIDAGLSLSGASKYLAKRHGIKKNIIYNLR